MSDTIRLETEKDEPAQQRKCSTELLKLLVASVSLLFISLRLREISLKVPYIMPEEKCERTSRNNWMQMRLQA